MEQNARVKTCIGAFFGLSGFDVVYEDTCLPERDHKVKATRHRLVLGGTALNAARTFARLGGEALLVTAIGDSPLGEAMKAMIRAEGIRVFDLTPDRKEVNVSTVFLRGNTRTLISGQAPLPDCFVPPNLPRFDFALYDLNLPKWTRPLVETIMGPHLVLDAGSPKGNDGFALSHAECIIMSEHFDKQPLSSFCARRCSPSALIARTRGAKNIQWHARENSGEIDVTPIEEGNTLGAGDVFHGAFCYYYYGEHLPFEKSLQKANEIAAMHIRGIWFEADEC